MKMLIGFEVEMADTTARKLIETAGTDLQPPDYPVALALAALAAFPGQMRQFLLDPSHTPVPLNVHTALTTERSAIALSVTITTPDESNPLWKTPNAPTPPESSPKPKPAKKAAKKRSTSTSKSRSPRQ